MLYACAYRWIDIDIYVGVLRHFSHIWLFKTLWTAAFPAPLSMGFSRQEYWCELPCSPPGDLPNPGIEPVSLMSPACARVFFTTTAAFIYIYNQASLFFTVIVLSVSFLIFIMISWHVIKMGFLFLSWDFGDSKV